MRRSFLLRPVPEGTVAVLALWLGLLALLVLPATAGAAGTVYVTSFLAPPGSQPGSISQFAIGSGGQLSPLSPASVATGVSPLGVAVTPNGKSVYAVNVDIANHEPSVSQYDVDPKTGALSPKTPATVAAGAPGEANYVAVTPDGHSAYVTHGSPTLEGTVLQYDIDPQTGALSPKTPPAVAAGIDPTGVAVSPDGRSAYVANFVTDPSIVSQYDIDPQTGALSPKSPATVAAGTSPRFIAVTPDGRSAYVSNPLLTNSISQFDIDPSSGALSLKTPATVISPEGALDIAVTPDSKSAYVTGGFFVTQFDINPLDGTLSPKTPATIRAGHSTVGVAVTPDGSSAYVVNSLDATVSLFDIDPQTGALSPKSPATVPTTDPGPAGIAIGPLPRVPTSKEQCKNGGWRNFPQFKNEGLCIAFVNQGP